MTKLAASLKHLSSQYLSLVGLLAFTCLAFSKGVTRSFSSDDYAHLENNVHFETLGQVLQVFLYSDGREYRPLVRLSLWLNYQMGQTAIPFKLSNLAMHLACVALLYVLMVRLGIARTAALIGAAVFALHPIHVTSVHFVLGRTDLVAAVFYLATLVTVAGWNSRVTLSQYLISALFFAGALCSKELSITLPVLMFSVLLLKHETISKQAVFDCFRKLWPFAIIAAIFLAVRAYLWMGMTDAISVYADFSPRNIVTNYFGWMFGLLYPFDLYEAQEALALHPIVFASIALAACVALSALVAAIFWQTRRSLFRSPLLWFGLFWILVTLTPMAGGRFLRWYLYLPSAGLGFVIASLWKYVPDSRRLLLSIALAVLLLLFTAETVRQSIVWEKQSDLSEAFLNDFERQGLYKLDHLFFANVPFGYNSAFLFTHGSLASATQFRHGYAPKIDVLSYVNVDDNTSIGVEDDGSSLTFRMQPDPYRYFLFSAEERRFSSLGLREIHGYKLTIDELGESGRIKRYSIKPDSVNDPVYYFDGRSIKRFDPQAVNEIRKLNV